jgi:peroxin-1
LSASPLATVKSTLSLLIARANWSRPSVLILDGLDALCGVEMEHVDTTRTRLVAEMMVSLFGPGQSTNLILPGVVVIATAKGEADVNPLLGGKHLFGEKVSLAGLNKDGRREVSRPLPSDVHPASADVSLPFLRFCRGSSTASWTLLRSS